MKFTPGILPEVSEPSLGSESLNTLFLGTPS
jgi:hypothetical protein